MEREAERAMKTAAHIALCTLAGLLGYQIRQLFSITGKALIRELLLALLDTA